MAALRTGDGLADVVVTAVASTTALAPDAEETWQQLLEGGSGIRQLDKWFIHEYESPVRIGGALREDFDEHLNRVELRRLSYLGKMSTVVGRRLWAAAGSPEVDTSRLLVSIGTALANTEEIAEGAVDGTPVVCGRCHRWRCRCTCRMRRPPRSGWNARPEPV